MTRERQIVEAAKAKEKETGFGELVKSPISRGVNSAYGIGFLEGAEWADANPNNPYKDVIGHMSSNAYRVWKQNLWHDAQGENLPPIDREVIVLCDDGYGGYKVCFGHRPVESYTIINHSKMEKYYPERYGKGGWNIPDVKWWLDVELPYIE